MRLTAISLLLMLGACTTSSDEPRLATEPTVHTAELAIENGNPALALKIADNLLKRDPGDVDALAARGDALFELGQTGLAVTSFQDALRRDSGSVRAMVGLGRAKLNTDPVAAETLFMRALRSEPRNVSALNDMGIAADMQGRHADAQANYRKAMALAPENLATQLNLGLSLAKSGDKAGALEILQPMAANQETPAQMRANLATALTAAGDPASAEKINGVDPEVQQ